MADPRNIAHDKKVQKDKEHHDEEVVPAAVVTPQPGKKPPLEDHPETTETYQQHVHNARTEESE